MLIAKTMNEESLSRTGESPTKFIKEETNPSHQGFSQITLISIDNQTDLHNDSQTINMKLISFRKKVEDFLDSYITTITMSIATVYALFADDIMTLGFPKSDDVIFSSLFIICLFLFTLELTLSFVFKPGYKWSFYFWLDLIATLSLIPDLE